MKSKKIFILLPDGVGLRNFAFTSFVKNGERMGWEVIFWNQTPFNLTQMGYKEIKLHGAPRAKTDLLKRAKIISELNYFEKKFNDPVYQSYKFPNKNKGLKAKVKNGIVSLLTKIYKGETGLIKLRKQLKNSERDSKFYKKCKELLKNESPDFIFCTNQRPVNAITPIIAAQDLGIPTGTFIFSWDNLPKATMVVESDVYFVWSEYMKKELLRYYPFIRPSKILITGTPQFELHNKSSLSKTRELFFSENNLDLTKKYICFSGDDETTSPDDPHYLLDVASKVKTMNENGANLGIIFRRCPVDFSNRYDGVINKYSEIIVPLDPIWKQVGGEWNTIFPTLEDQVLQINTILHSEAVINLGSSMAFDYALLNKPCLFLNYDVKRKVDVTWSSKKVYKFVHFRSMPTGNEVIWLKEKNEIESKLNSILECSYKTVKNAKAWFEVINMHPPEKASERIWSEINKIISNN